MGKIIVKTKGLNSARTLSELSKNKITIKNAKKINTDLIFETNKKDKKIVQNSLKKLYLECEFEEKKDFFANIFSIWRLGILLGILVCVIVYSLLSGFVLDIEISGVNQNKQSEMTYFLINYGVKVGKKKSEFDLVELEKAVLQNFDFSVVSLTYVGTTLVCNVKEELDPPIYMDLSQKSPLVAVEDALVTRIVRQSGTKQIEIGQSVKKGQTLISCEKIVGDSEYFVRAVGEVYGKVWREKEIFLPDQIEELVPTGREEKVYSYRFGNHSSAVPKSTFETYTYLQTSIRIGNFLSIYRDETVYIEQKKVQRTLTSSDIDKMVELAKKEIFAENQELVGTFIDLWTIERKVDGGKFLKVVAEFETRIDKYA